MTGRRLLFAAIIIAVAATSGTSASVVGQGVDLEPRQLRVTWSTDPAHRATVSWSTTAAGVAHAIHYDVEARVGVLADYAFSSDVVTSGAYVADGPFFHHAVITELPADTNIFFTVETDGEVSEELYFLTAPTDADAPIEFLYGGDSRTGREDRQKMNQLIARLHGDDPDILALVHGGDYIDFANTWWQWNDWLDDHELTIGADGRVLPIVPAKGNHEGRGGIYNAVFGEPSGDVDRNWFFTRFGQLALITLDTEASQAGEQRDWLAARLAEGREARWLLMNYHRPAYPAVKSPSGAREHWVPLFEEFDVDLVMESDGHALKRTPPIRNEAVDFTGVTYIGEGGLGVPQRTPREDLWYLQSPGIATSAHHVQKVELSEELLRYQALLMDGSVADEITILPRAERLAQRITPIDARAPSPRHIAIELSRPFDPVTAIELEWTIEPAKEVARVEIGDQVTAVLALANSLDERTLDIDVGLDTRAARNISSIRIGPDGVAGTEDDITYRTWAELDAVAFVGTQTLAALTKYALDGKPNEHNVVTLSLAEDLEEGQMVRVRVPAIEDRDGAPVEDGTTIGVVFTRPDDRADAFAALDYSAEPAESGCATSGARPGAGGVVLVFVCLFGVRRARNARRGRG